MHMILCLHDFCCLLCVVTVLDEIATGVLMDLDFFLQNIFRSYLIFLESYFQKRGVIHSWQKYFECPQKKAYHMHETVQSFIKYKLYL